MGTQEEEWLKAVEEDPLQVRFLPQLGSATLTKAFQLVERDSYRGHRLE